MVDVKTVKPTPETPTKEIEAPKKAPTKTKTMHEFDAHEKAEAKSSATKTSPKVVKSGNASGESIKRKILLTVLYIAWTFFGSYAGQIIVAFPMSWILGGAIKDPVWTLVYYTVTYTITLILVLLVPLYVIKLYRKRTAKPSPESVQLEKDFAVSKEGLGIAHLPTFVDIGLAPICYIAYVVLASILTRIMSYFPWFDAQQTQDVGFSYYITDLDRIFAMLAVVFIAPIAEELIMRGWLYGKVRSKWGVAVSILVVSLVFALLHGQWNVGVNVFALSVMLCGLREITGTVWSGMLLHILSNGIAFYLLYVAI